MKFKGKTVFITGASRGIGLAIAEKLASEGANIIVAAKTAEPHPKLEGTIYTAAEAIEKAGGKALAQVVDVRSEESVQAAVDAGVKAFGGIDVLINNASAIFIARTADTPLKKYDLMHQVNVRGTWLVSKVCLPHLKASKDPKILNMSPPLNMNPKWFKDHCAYTMTKYGMSMCVLGMAEEFAADGIKVNALWPKTAIATAAVKYMLGGDKMIQASRTTDIMADAAEAILSGNETGQFYVDEDLLRTKGVENFDHYAVSPGTPLIKDFYVE